MNARGIEWRLFARQAAVPFIRRLFRGRLPAAVRVLASDGRAILAHRMWPDEALQFGECLDEVRRARPSLFLQADLVRSTRPFAHSVERYGLASKLEFASFCAAHELAHPPTARLSPNALPIDFGEPLFIKPDRGSSAKGVAVLRSLPDGRWWRIGNEGSAEGELTALVPNGGPFVAQPLLRNHATIAAIAGPTLATFRIVTGRRLSGEVEALSALAELPLDDEEPIARRWLTVPVELSTGRIAPPSESRLARLSPTERERAAACGGFRVPQWQAMFALVANAHERLTKVSPEPLPPLIGWDSAMTPAGPMLLEPNWNWAVVPHYCNAAGLDFRLSPVFARFAEGW